VGFGTNGGDDGPSGVLDIGDIPTIAAFESEWDDRMGGDATHDLRMMIGIAMSQIVKRGVHPRALAVYLREALRLMEPDKFDAS
jgi:hypothetical protein